MAATRDAEAKQNNEGPGDMPKGMRKEFLSFMKVHNEPLLVLGGPLCTLCS